MAVVSLVSTAAEPEHPGVNLFVLVNHPVLRKALEGTATNFGAVQLRDLGQGEDRLVQIVDKEAVDAVLNRLRQGTGATGDDRGAGRHRFDRHEPEWFRPCAEHHRGTGAGNYRVAGGGAELAEELDDALIDRRLNDLAEVVVLGLVVDLGDYFQRHACASRKFDCLSHSLLGCHTSDEDEVVTWLTSPR